jgi:HEAT repeat protein
VIASQSPRALVAYLDDPSPEVARMAMRRLAESDGDTVAAELRARLLDADLSLVPDIAKALQRTGDGTAVQLAIAGLRQQPYTRRVAAAQALGVLGATHAAPSLRAALNDDIAAVRIAVLGALAHIGPQAGAATECARLLSDPDSHVRAAAVRAVTRIAARPGPLIARAAADSDRVVRTEVARALLGDADIRVREAAAGAAGFLQATQLATLLVSDPASDVRHAAAATLGRVGDHRVADRLIAGIEDRDAIVRAAVLRGLEEVLTRADAIERLSGELMSERAERRRASLYGLLHLRAREAGESVRRLVEDPDPDVRLALVRAADALLAEPEAVVRELAADSDQVVRHSAEIWLLRRTISAGESRRPRQTRLTLPAGGSGKMGSER